VLIAGEAFFTVDMEVMVVYMKAKQPTSAVWTVS
jgi:hypothetical protein